MRGSLRVNLVKRGLFLRRVKSIYSILMGKKYNPRKALVFGLSRAIKKSHLFDLKSLKISHDISSVFCQ